MTYNMAKFVQFLCQRDCVKSACQAYNDYAKKLGVQSMTTREASKYSRKLVARFKRERRTMRKTGVRSTWNHFKPLARCCALLEISKKRKRKREREESESETVTAPSTDISSDDSVGCSDVPEEPRATKRQRPLCAFAEPAIHMLLGVESMLQHAETGDDLQQLRLEEAVRRCREVIAAVERLSDA